MEILLLPSPKKRPLPRPGRRLIQKVYRKNSATKIILGVILTLILFVLVVNTSIYGWSKKYIVDEEKLVFATSTEPIVAIVLGASVYSNGNLTPILEDRANLALELYKSNAVEKILITGDNHDKSYNEVVPVRTFLISKEVPAEDIFTDFAGLDTYDSMYRAANIFEVKRALIITQRFHLPRALYAARSLGVDAYGIPADQRRYNLKNDFRELFATVKTFFEIKGESKPRFLGDKILISGDGRKSFP